jgi:hypothetical protein
MLNNRGDALSGWEYCTEDRKYQWIDAMLHCLRSVSIAHEILHALERGLWYRSQYGEAREAALDSDLQQAKIAGS